MAKINEPVATIFPKIEEVIKKLEPLKISDERKAVLKPLTEFVKEKVLKKQEIRINFICTHNSRRSHLAQVWAQTFAHFFNIRNVVCYSGGTEATALFPTVAETLQNCGFQVNMISKGDNPVYTINYSENEHPIIGFSKKLNDDFNPKSEFAAVLTCDSAQEACPFVLGAEAQIPIIFSDPKAYDNSVHQAEKYGEKSLEIATELFYIFSQIN